MAEIASLLAGDSNYQKKDSDKEKTNLRPQDQKPIHSIHHGGAMLRLRPHGGDATPLPVIQGIFRMRMMSQ